MSKVRDYAQLINLTGKEKVYIVPENPIAGVGGYWSTVDNIRGEITIPYHINTEETTYSEEIFTSDRNFYLVGFGKTEENLTCEYYQGELVSPSETIAADINTNINTVSVQTLPIITTGSLTLNVNGFDTIEEEEEPAPIGEIKGFFIIKYLN
jgi:hypothetical protein